jgi:hypothetical protein
LDFFDSPFKNFQYLDFKPSSGGWRLKMENEKFGIEGDELYLKKNSTR